MRFDELKQIGDQRAAKPRPAPASQTYAKDEANRPSDLPLFLRSSERSEQPTGIQKKPLEVSHPADPNEKEADEVARKVVGGQSAKIKDNIETASGKSRGSEETTSEFQSKLESNEGRGQSLDDSTRSEMESKMGGDFGLVRIHTDAEADDMNASLNARAFTHASEIFFRQGEFDTASTPGKELLAHELVHTVQQKKGVERTVQRQPVPQSDWTNDKSDQEFNTKAEAQARRTQLEQQGRWEEYAIDSITRNGIVYWRVQMRGRRTMANFLTLLRKAEKAYPSWTKEQMVNSLRRLGRYDTDRFQLLYGTAPADDLAPVPDKEFTAADISLLEQMLRHGGSGDSETGVVKDFSGEYLALGHVMTGISGGLHRNKQADLVPWYGLAGGEKMDNLYAATLSGDLGQSAVLVNEGKQTEYVGAGTEATDAELAGDIDGIILGEALSAADYKKKWDAIKTLSDFIESYYKSISRERFAFAEKIDPLYLRDQITRFAETYAYRESKLTGATSAVGAESEASYKAYTSWLAGKKPKKAQGQQGKIILTPDKR